MDIITQLQEQVNKMAFMAFNTVGSLQRDAPSGRLSQNYPEPPVPAADAAAAFAEQPQAMASALLQAAKQLDALIAALPPMEGGEEAQLKRIAQLQAENDEVGKELQQELDAAERELLQVRELFHKAADDCLHFKQPN